MSQLGFRIGSWDLEGGGLVTDRSHSGHEILLLCFLTHLRGIRFYEHISFMNLSRETRHSARTPFHAFNIV
jgi:hypothetical protein